MHEVLCVFLSRWTVNYAWSIFLLISGDVHIFLSRFYDLWLNENYILKLTFFFVEHPGRVEVLLAFKSDTLPSPMPQNCVFFYEPRAVKKRKTPSLWILRVLHHLIQSAVSQERGNNNFQRLLYHISCSLRIIFHRLEAGSCCNKRR